MSAIDALWPNFICPEMYFRESQYDSTKIKCMQTSPLRPARTVSFHTPTMHLPLYKHVQARHRALGAKQAHFCFLWEPAPLFGALRADKDSTRMLESPTVRL